MSSMQFKKFHGLRSIPARPPQNSLSFRQGWVFLTVVAPQLRTRFQYRRCRVAQLSLAPCMSDFASSPGLCGQSSVCVTSFRVTTPFFFFSLLSQKTSVNIAGHGNAAWVSSVPYQDVLATKLLWWLPCHWVSCTPGCAMVLPSRTGGGGQVPPCTPCFMSTSSLCGSSISSTRLSRPYPPLTSSKCC